MKTPRITTVLALLCAVLGCTTSNLSAIVLNWDGEIWASGAISQSYETDSAKTGNDVTLTMGGSTGELAPDSITDSPTPQVNKNLEGGLNPVQNSLNIRIDLGKKDRFVSVTISFSAAYTNGVSNVSFSIFGIDQATGNSNIYIDEIRSMTALLNDGSTVITPTITNLGAAVSLTGSGVGQTLTGIAHVPETGAGSGAGNATLNFNADGIRSITFVFGAGGNAATNPTFEEISISDLSYSPVPEMNPALSAIAACGASLVLMWRRSRSARRENEQVLTQLP